MKDPMRLVDRFCYKHPNFGIPGLARYIAVGSGAAWVIGLINPVLYAYLTLKVGAVLQGQIWRLVSFMFVPYDTSWLGFISILFYYWIGSTLERYWGSGKFTVYVLVNMLLTILCGLLLYALGSSAGVTASYVYLAMFFAFAVYFPDMQVLFMMIIPIKMKYLAYLDAVFFVLAIVRNPFPLNLVPVVAILGFLLFCGGELLGRLPKRASAQTVNFRRESARIRREQREALYHHKCAVCGRTDTEYPDLQFRYCSRCAGYHCFCEDHINNHVHFTE
jgi:membrane associated rhomboid family serine protease